MRKVSIFLKNSYSLKKERLNEINIKPRIMKTFRKVTPVLLSVFIFLFTVCNEPQKQIKEINTTKTYSLDTLKSDANWKRFLEQGKTKTKVKLFGQLADVTIDGLKLNTDGNVILNSGEMINHNDTLTKGTIIFDLNLVSVKSQKTKNDKLLKTKKLKDSKFSISITKEDTAVYYMENKMTIGNVTKEPITTAHSDYKNDSIFTIIGEVKFNTLDWPIRDDDNVKSVIKDEITIEMELFFNLVDVEKDTVYMTN